MNEKMMKRTVYEAPVTELFRIELEGNFCGSVVQDKPQSGVETTGHEINEIDLGDAAYDSWNKNGTWE